MHRNLIEMGDHSYGSIHIEGHTYHKVYVGRYTSIAAGVVALMTGHHTNWVSTYPFHAWPEFGHKRDGRGIPYGDIRIGNDVWIGFNVILLGGVMIGDGAIVCASAFVNKDVAPYEMVGGVPAKHIRFRFTAEQIEALLRIKWWDWPDEKIKENAMLLVSPNIDEFIRKYGRVR
jgi:acetyltransferase-like isoleucine patch superfamily enzyme